MTVDHLGRLRWPAGRALAARELAPLLVELGAVATDHGDPALAALATAAAADVDSPDRLYELGYALIDAGTPAVAATVLARCLALVPDSEEVVCELVSALESALAYRDAFAVLGAHPTLRARSFLCRYLYAFNAAMIGELAVTRAELVRLAPDSDETTAMRDAIAGIVARADQVAGIAPLDATDLRGWHYVLTGGVLLHQSPHGFPAPMAGRYAWLADSDALIATGLDRVVALCRAAAAPPPCVYAPPGRANDVLAHAAAHRLGVSVAPWPAVGLPAPGLVVLHDLATLTAADIPRLVARRPDQILFAHAAPWTVDQPVAPDLVTLLYQAMISPWDDDEAPLDRSAIAAELAGHAGLAADDLAADEPERLAALIARVWPLAPGPRARLWAGGPVASNRFA